MRKGDIVGEGAAKDDPLGGKPVQQLCNVLIGGLIGHTSEDIYLQVGKCFFRQVFFQGLRRHVGAHIDR